MNRLFDRSPAHVAHLDGLDALGAGGVAAGEDDVLLALHADRAAEVLLPLVQLLGQLGVGGGGGGRRRRRRRRGGGGFVRSLLLNLGKTKNWNGDW